MNQYFYIKEHPVINLIIVTIQQQPFQRKHVVQFLQTLSDIQDWFQTNPVKMSDCWGLRNTKT